MSSSKHPPQIISGADDLSASSADGADATPPARQVADATPLLSGAQVTAFWREAGPKRWFKRDPAFDDRLRTRLEATHIAASRGELDSWIGDAESALALVLLTDQVPRNIYRRSAHAFATDERARWAAGRALEAGHDAACEPAVRIFFYLPFEHHEDAQSQARAVALFTRHAELTGDANSLRYAHLHAALIAQFGRFPHRNLPLCRPSTAEEADYLAKGGFAG
jgi:uncharacterized protein (DUF924 family)